MNMPKNDPNGNDSKNQDTPFVLGKRPPGADGKQSFNFNDPNLPSHWADRIAHLDDGKKAKMRFVKQGESNFFQICDMDEDLYRYILAHPDLVVETASRVINGVDYPDFEIVSSQTLGAKVKKTCQYRQFEEDGKNVVLFQGFQYDEIK